MQTSQTHSLLQLRFWRPWNLLSEFKHRTTLVLRMVTVMAFVLGPFQKDQSQFSTKPFPVRRCEAPNAMCHNALTRGPLEHDVHVRAATQTSRRCEANSSSKCSTRVSSSIGLHGLHCFPSNNPTNLNKTQTSKRTMRTCSSASQTTRCKICISNWWHTNEQPNSCINYTSLHCKTDTGNGVCTSPCSHSMCHCHMQRTQLQHSTCM